MLSGETEAEGRWFLLGGHGRHCSGLLYFKSPESGSVPFFPSIYFLSSS